MRTYVGRTFILGGSKRRHQPSLRGVERGAMVSGAYAGLFSPMTPSTDAGARVPVQKSNPPYVERMTNLRVIHGPVLGIPRVPRDAECAEGAVFIPLSHFRCAILIKHPWHPWPHRLTSPPRSLCTKSDSPRIPLWLVSTRAGL